MLMIISLHGFGLHDISVAVKIVVTITFQSEFYLQMYQDNIYFFKNLFLISANIF
jgi:hypothetical protein